MAKPDSALLISCANWQSDAKNCSGKGKLACGGCRLVSYCGKECQKAHWIEHKTYCKSPLMKVDWSPSWETEGRAPAFVGGPPMVPFGPSQKYLWGNMPALDVLCLDRNEGNSYDQGLHVLFAASGDIRNVVKTVACLSNAYKQPVSLVLNDRDFDIIARNFIMLLLTLDAEDTDQTLDTVIHIWYSAKIRLSHLYQLQSRIRPLLQEVCKKIANKPDGTILGKTWTFGSQSLRLTLPKEKWMLLPSYLEIPDGLSLSQADAIRKATTLAYERRDYRDRNTFLHKPPHRVCIQRFREEGVFLPFSLPRQAFDNPNPTVCRNHDTWPMKDSADPFDGWNMAEVLQTAYGPAENDMYGKLFHFVRDMLSSFRRQVTSRNTAFELFNMDVHELPKHLNNRAFARIEVSNISDRAYLGIFRTLNRLCPLLQKPSDNPHATFITLFMNAVGEMVNQSPPNRSEATSSGLEVIKYLPYTRPPRSTYDPVAVKHVAAYELVRDNDKYFDKYMKEGGFTEMGRFLGMRMKKTHTIVEKWPLRLKLRFGQPGAQEEFDILLPSSHSGAERYVEWAVTNSTS